MIHAIRDGFETFKKYLADQSAGDGKIAGIAVRLDPRVGKGDLKIMDHAFFSIKSVVGNRIQMVELADVEVLGVRNITNAKPEQGQCMLLEQIKLVGHQYPDGANINDAYLATAKFTNLYDFPGFQNGTITIRTDQKVIINKRPISDLCEEDGNGEVERGTITLRTPKFIIPDAQLEVTIELGPQVVPTRMLLKVEMKGLCTQTV